MAARMTELEPRLLERLRAELAEVLASGMAYPAFFDFRANREITRPIDRARLEEIQLYLRSTNFSQIERTDVTSPELRRFLERLIQRYLDINEAMHGRYAARYRPRMRALAARLATETQRRAIGFANGSTPDFGVRRQTISWTNQSRRGSRRSDEERERATRVLEAALQQRSSLPAQPQDDHTGASTSGLGSAASASPFGAFADEAKPTRAPSLYDQATGPMPTTHASPPRQAGPVPMRELSADLFNLYGDYLSDMSPEAPPQPAPQPSPQPMVPAPQRGAPQRPIGSPTNETPEARNDQLIFWQLRYQLEAYIVRAARSYGVPFRGGDPATVLDALRQSGFVDESDLRIAEGIFALTDRVTSQGHASDQEYRQALMLYLLYHRSHLTL